MGVGYSGPKPLKVFFDYGTHFAVALDCANYHEGSKASGNLTFTLDRSTPSISVYVSIIGYENVLWRKRVRRGKNSRVVTYRDHTAACNQKFMVMQSNEGFLPGTYSYPFNFQVPANIPGTYGHESGYHSNKAQCSCTYTFYCELITAAEPIALLGRAACPIVIMQKARTPYNYDMKADITNKVTTCCCVNRGNVGVHCTFEKDVVRIDEAVHMKFRIDNSDCKISISKIKATLKRKLFLKCRDGLSTYRENVMIALPLPGCAAGEKIDEKVVKFDLNKARDIGTPAGLAGSLGEFAGKIQQTCNGSLINCSYELHVTAEVSGCVCCESHPSVYAPIEILAPERVLVFQPMIYAPIGGEELQAAPGEGVPAEGAPSGAYPPGGVPPGAYAQAPAPYQAQAPPPIPAPYDPSQQYTNPTIPAPPSIGSEASKVKKVENEEDSLE
ncbi:unnamed protein product [Moneuplotes crassus]|uniref:Arrestin C-terminal-like domain-containing protein n=1 Tax=Euplotes crassus TaxID=5936 RepID=A0AAD1UJV9_EUPCR|nr:unnamed protein product [Moneuplotes crassus]